MHCLLPLPWYNLQKQVRTMEALFQPLVQGDFDSEFQYMKHHMMAR
jgi:hypothetical protein